MKRVFLDTNILMDAIEFRKHGAEANLLLDLCRAGHIQTCASVITFATLSYLLRHHTKEDYAEFCDIPFMTALEFLNSMV